MFSIGSQKCLIFFINIYFFCFVFFKKREPKCYYGFRSILGYRCPTLLSSIGFGVYDKVFGIDLPAVGRNV